MATRVLVVDDAAFMRITIKNMLQKSEHEVVGEAENGRVAVEKYKELHPDVVTMDITMPKMDGVTDVTVDLEGGKADVKATHDISEADFRKVIEEAGYELVG